MNTKVNASFSTRLACGRLLAAAGLMLMTAATAHASYQSTVLADSPLAFYALNPATDPANTAPDLTGNGNNGFSIGTTAGTGPSAYITNAAFFNGEAAIDLSQGSNPNLLNFQGPITLEVWAQPSSSTEFGDLLARGYDSINSSEIFIRVNGPYGADFQASSGSEGVTGGTQTTNWTYVVLSSDGTNCTLYINGLQVAQTPYVSGSTTNFPAGNDDWVIANGSSSGSSRPFTGNLSEVAIYNHGLTAAQVLNHYYVGLLNTPATTSVPIITTQPQSQASYVGGSVTLSVSSVSALPSTNQWFFGNNPITGQTGSTLTLNNLQLTNAGNYSVVIGNANGTTNSAIAALSVTTPRNLEWSYDNGANNATWDNSTSPNWLNLANSQETVFNPGDSVLFDDTANVPTSVTLSGTIVPSLITVNSANNNFSFSSGTLSGSGGIVKEGPSTLNITSAGNGSFTGPVTVSGGLLYAGNNCLDTSASIIVTNASTLDFGGGQIQGHQTVTVSGSGFNGQGALINSYNDYPTEVIDINVAGDALISGTARWDLGSGSQITGNHNLTVDWSPDSANGYYGQWNSLQIGANVGGIFVTNGMNSANVCALGLTGMDAAFLNPATVLTLATNCQLLFYGGGFNGSLHLLGGSTLFHYTSPAGFYGSTLTLENNSTLQSYYNSGTTTTIKGAVILNGVAHFVIGDHTMAYTNVISGPGGFVEDYYNNNMLFSASNTYSGPTIIGSIGNSPEVALTGNGSISHSALIFFGGTNTTLSHIDVSGRSDNTLTLVSGQTLQGIGGITGSLVVDAGATVTPGGTNTTIGITTGSNPVGELAASDNVTLNGTTVIKLDGTNSDVVVAAATITYGGTLNLVNISGSPLTAGSSFQIFNAATYSGSFGNIVPTTPGPGLTWNTSQLSSGIISVAGAATKPVITSTKLSGGSLIFSGTGGTPLATFTVASTTNLINAVWVPVATGTNDASGNFSVTNVINPNIPHEFYRIQ